MKIEKLRSVLIVDKYTHPQKGAQTIDKLSHVSQNQVNMICNGCHSENNFETK